MNDRFKKIRLVVSDIDGTLLTSDNNLHPATLDAIHSLRKRSGCDFTLSTGRSFPLSYPVMRHLGLSAPFIFSGGAIFDSSTQAVLTDHFIDAQTVDAIRHFAQERGLGLIAHTARCMLCMLDDADWERISSIEWIKGQKTDHANRVDTITADPNDPVIRFDIFSEDKPLAAAFIQVCHSFPQLHAVQMSRSIELTPTTVNKGSALRKLVALQHINLDQVMALGDSLNDMALLEEAGIGVAMATAPEALKSVADVIVPPSDEGGFADALELLTYLH